MMLVHQTEVRQTDGQKAGFVMPGDSVTPMQEMSSGLGE